MEGQSIPLGLSMALAQNTRAQDWFFGLPAQEQQRVAAAAARMPDADAIRAYLEHQTAELP